MTDVGHALIPLAEGQAPPRLDRARWCLVDHIDDALPLALGDRFERVLDRLGGASITVPVERRVGQAAMRRNGRRLPFRALQRRYIGRRSSLRLRHDVIAREIELAHGVPPVLWVSSWHMVPAFSRCPRSFCIVLLCAPAIPLAIDGVLAADELDIGRAT